MWGHLVVYATACYNYAYLGLTWTREKPSRYAQGKAQRWLWGRCPSLASAGTSVRFDT